MQAAPHVDFYHLQAEYQERLDMMQAEHQEQMGKMQTEMWRLQDHFRVHEQSTLDHTNFEAMQEKLHKVHSVRVVLVHVHMCCMTRLCAVCVCICSV
jgi:Skp family chaperone for outer membrane proteins